MKQETREYIEKVVLDSNCVPLQKYLDGQFKAIDEKVRLAKEAVDAKANIANIIAAIATALTLYSLLRQ